ncbi:hypothetical protein ACFVVU_03740 [Kitasatospora sp. NPDC057965]|uniref:hypothetical protein n=1 Tax=Kitasatospora sp. NPDC057965 TaxID=3346291 RepID=UPI0036D899F1
MTGIAITLRALYEGERRLEDELLAVAQRHRAEHEIRHVATDLARWSGEHGRRLAETARHHGLDLPGPHKDPEGVAREKTAETPGLHLVPGLPLLDDLRGLHLSAADNSLHWEMLAQAARATHDLPLLGAATDCHPRTLRQMRWTNTMIKTLSPQLLTSL